MYIFKIKYKDLLEEGLLEDSIKTLNKYKNKPGFFMHFTDVHKLGINPKSNFNTPLGIYGYPITDILIEQYEKSYLPFAGDRKYIVIFRMKEWTTFNQESSVVTEEILLETVNKVKELCVKNQNITDEKLKNQLEKRIDGIFELSKKETRNQSSQGIFWYFVMQVSNMIKPYQDMSNTSGWSLLLRQLGYKAFFDQGLGIIHSNEETQAFSLTKDNVDLVEIVENGNNKEQKANRNRKNTSKQLKELLQIYKDYLYESATLLIFYGTVPDTERFSRHITELRGIYERNFRYNQSKINPNLFSYKNFYDYFVEELKEITDDVVRNFIQSNLKKLKLVEPDLSKYDQVLSSFSDKDSVQGNTQLDYDLIIPHFIKKIKDIEINISNSQKNNKENK